MMLNLKPRSNWLKVKFIVFKASLYYRLRIDNLDKGKGFS